HRTTFQSTRTTSKKRETSLSGYRRHCGLYFGVRRLRRAFLRVPLGIQSVLLAAIFTLTGTTPMNPEGSVTHWIALLQSGDDDAVRSLWERYFRGLVELARKRLCGSALVGEDEQIALSAFDSFCRGARAGRFPDLSGRDNLWGLLLTITTRKVADLVQHE